jgi:DNA (cytosine-5)-methyltransferase 1
MLITHPIIIYPDITKRNHKKLPDIDMYVCGFPCQPFSAMGKKLSTADPRGNIMLECISVIKAKSPKIFVLENVKNFKFIENGEPFEFLLNELRESGIYNVYHDILNTRDYGIPQNRQRIYIIGVRKDIQLEEYATPEKIPMVPLDTIIIDKTICYDFKIPKCVIKKLNEIGNLKNCVCPNSNFGNYMKGMSPTLTTGCAYYYHSTYNRYLTAKECLSLQGFPTNFKQVVGKTKMFKQIGNSMSVNVLKVLFERLFKITKPF